MLEAKYYKDYRHNYMILQCGRREAVGSYQHKILTSGKIGEILKCYVRHINGTVYYYYDVSSRTTLDSLYRNRRMSLEQVKDVLWQLHGICDRLSGYFMDESCLVLQPEHIYYDLTDKKYIGLYYPDYEMPKENACGALMDYLLEHIDTEDQELTDKMYRIYEMSEEAYFTLEDALQVLEETTESVQHQPEELDLQTVYEPMKESPEQQPVFDMEEGAAPGAARRDVCCGYEDAPRRTGLFYPVFMCLSILGAAGALAVWCLYELTVQEKTILGISAAAMGACALICLLRVTGEGRRRQSDGKKSGKETGEKPGQDTEWDIRVREKYMQEADTVSLEHVLSRDMELCPEPECVPSHRNLPSRRVTVDTGQPGDCCGNTVFFDESRMTEYKLYALDKRNKQHIELRKFPCTIGKMAGCVDHVLTDDSVSRIHARLDREGEKVLLTDMNSTNGTYKNGLRMQPQETVEIEAGDEIRFGSLNYCYR